MSTIMNSKAKENMKDFPYGDLDWYLWLLLFRARDIVFKARRKELSLYNLSCIEAGTLLVIKTIGAPTPAQISRWLLREPHSISELVNRMEKEGLVKKFNDLTRKNLVRVVLTEKGERVFHKTLERRSIHKIMSALSEEERQQLRSCLETLLYKAQKALGMRGKPFFVSYQRGTSFLMDK